MVKPVRPWDLINPKSPRSSEDLQAERIAICKNCDRFISLTSQCSECGCVMPLKTKLSGAFCPLHKWESVF